MSLDWQVQLARPRGEGPARQPGAPSRRAARPAAGEGAAGRRAGRGRAAHLQPRVAGGARLQHDPRLAAGARAAAVAAGRCRRRLRRARVHPPLRRAADRRRARLLHRRWVPQGPAAQSAGGDHAGRQRKLGARQGRADRSDQPAGADAAARRDRALHRGIREAVGRPAGRPRHRADAQPAAGGAGPVHPGLAAIADARPARRHHPSAHADPAAATAARRRRCRAGCGAGCGRGGDAGREQCRRAAARTRCGQRAAAGTAGQGDRGPLRRADRLRRQGAGRADRQRAEAAERSAAAARQAGGSAGWAARLRPLAAATIPRSCCRPRPAAIRSRWRAGCRRWRSAATSCAAAARWIR